MRILLVCLLCVLSISAQNLTDPELTPAPIEEQPPLLNTDSPISIDKLPTIADTEYPPKSKEENSWNWFSKDSESEEAYDMADSNESSSNQSSEHFEFVTFSEEKNKEFLQKFMDYFTNLFA